MSETRKSKAEAWLERVREANRKKSESEANAKRVIDEDGPSPLISGNGTLARLTSGGVVELSSRSIGIVAFESILAWGNEWFWKQPSEESVKSMRDENSRLEAECKRLKAENDALIREEEARKDVERNNTDPAPKFCDDCIHLHLTGAELDRISRNKRLGRGCGECGIGDMPLYHGKYRPNIPRPDNCPGFKKATPYGIEMFGQKENTPPQMTNNPSVPFLTARHPDTGEWRRWELVRWSSPRTGEFFIRNLYEEAAHPVLDTVVDVWDMVNPMSKCRWILRDAGPALYHDVGVDIGRGHSLSSIAVKGPILTDKPKPERIEMVVPSGEKRRFGWFIREKVQRKPNPGEWFLLSDLFYYTPRAVQAVNPYSYENPVATILHPVESPAESHY